MKPVYINGIRGMCDNASLHVTEQIVPGAVLGGFSCTGPEGDTRYYAAAKQAELSWSWLSCL